MVAALRALVSGVALAFVVVTSTAYAGPFGPTFVRGDVDQDGEILVNDPILLLTALFGSPGTWLPCQDAADVNDDGQLNIADPISALNYLFVGGPQPPEPFPYCGPDPTSDVLDCADVNPTCIPPLYAYVLNAPSAIGAGNDSILQVEIAYNGTTTVTPVVGPDPAWNGLRHLETFYGVELVAVQNNPALGPERIVLLDGFSGTVEDDFDGYDGEIQALALSDPYIYVVTTQSMPAFTRILQISYLGSWQSNVVWEVPAVLDVQSLAVTFADDLFVSGATSTQSGIFEIVPPDGMVQLVDAPEVGPLRYDFLYGALEMLTSPPGNPLTLTSYDLGGSVIMTLQLADYVGVTAGDFGPLDSKVLIPLPDDDTVIIPDIYDGTVGTVGAADGVDHPIDAATPVILGVP